MGRTAEKRKRKCSKDCRGLGTDHLQLFSMHSEKYREWVGNFGNSVKIQDFDLIHTLCKLDTQAWQQGYTTFTTFTAVGPLWTLK